MLPKAPKPAILTVPFNIVRDLPVVPNVLLVLDKVSFPTPVFVKLNEPDTTALSIISLFPPIVASEPKIKAPAHVAAKPPLLISAPILDVPEPLIVSASAVAKVIPFKSNVPVPETVVPAPIVPKGELGGSPRCS
jgi:hypothetical protein